MSKDCWTCAYADQDFCMHQSDEYIEEWCNSECDNNTLMPPRDGDHPDCPGHEPKETR